MFGDIRVETYGEYAYIGFHLALILACFVRKKQCWQVSWSFGILIRHCWNGVSKGINTHLQWSVRASLHVSCSFEDFSWLFSLLRSTPNSPLQPLLCMLAIPASLRCSDLLNFIAPSRCNKFEYCIYPNKSRAYTYKHLGSNKCRVQHSNVNKCPLKCRKGLYKCQVKSCI